MATAGIEKKEVKNNLVDEGTRLYAHGVDLNEQKAALEAQGLVSSAAQTAVDRPGARRDIPAAPASTNPEYDRLTIAIAANEEAIIRLAEQWRAATGGTIPSYKAQIAAAYRANPDGIRAELAAERRRKIRQGTREQVTDMRAEIEGLKNAPEKLDLLAQELVDKNFSPIDLIQGDRTEELLQTLGFPPADAGNLEYRAELKDLLQQRYENLRNSKMQLTQLEEDTRLNGLSSRVKVTLKRLAHEPAAMVAVLGLTLTMYFGIYKQASDSQKKTILTGLAIGTSALGGGYLLYSMSPWVRRQLDSIGADPNKLAVTQIVKDFADKYHAFSEGDQLGLLDFARIVDLPMSAVIDVFKQGMNSVPRIMDARVLQRNGLDPDSAGRVDEQGLFKRSEFLFGTLCYNKAIEDPECPKADSLDDRLKIGLAWAQKYTERNPGVKLSTLMYMLTFDKTAPQNNKQIAANEMSIAGTKASREEMRAGREGLPGAGLTELVKKANLPSGTLRYLRDDIYLVKGYPVRYQFLNNVGTFTSLNNQRSFSLNMREESAVAQLRGMVEQFGADAQTEISRFDRVGLGLWENAHSSAEIHYTAGGVWEMVPPPQIRYTGTQLKGLEEYEKDKTVPVYFTYESGQLQMKVAGISGSFELRTDGPGALERAQMAYEKEIVLPEKIRMDAGHLLFDLPFKIDGVENVDSETRIKISYGAQSGTLVYSGEALKSLQLLAPEGSPLEEKWRVAAEEDVRKFTEDPEVQALLEQVTRKFAVPPAGATDYVASAWKDLKAYFGSFGESEDETRYQEAFVREVRNIQVTASQFLVKNLYSPKRVPMPDSPPGTFTFGDSRTGPEFARTKTEYLALYKDALRSVLDEKHDNPFDEKEQEARTALNVKPVEITYNKGTEQYKRYRDKLINEATDVLWEENTSSFLGLGLDRALTAHVRARVARAKAAMVHAIDDIKDPITNVKMKAVAQKFSMSFIRESGCYMGLDSRTAAMKLIENRLDGAHKTDWKEPTALVADYLQYKFKWEQYGILPSPENMVLLLDFWFKSIGNGATGLSDASDYITYAEQYFLPKVVEQIGNYEDWSLSGFMGGDLFTVNGDRFNAGFAIIQRNTLSAEEWFSASKPLLTSILPDTMTLYRDRARAEFWDRYDEYMGLNNWLAGNWPEVQRNLVERRLNAIIATSVSEADLQNELTRLSGFTSVQKTFYQNLATANLTTALNLEVIERIDNAAWDATFNSGKIATDYGNELNRLLVVEGVRLSDAWWMSPVTEFLGATYNMITGPLP